MQVSNDLLTGTFSSLSLEFSMLSGQFFPMRFSIPLKVFEEFLELTFFVINCFLILILVQECGRREDIIHMENFYLGSEKIFIGKFYKLVQLLFFFFFSPLLISSFCVIDSHSQVVQQNYKIWGEIKISSFLLFWNF